MWPLVNGINKSHIIIEYLRQNKVLSLWECKYEQSIFEQNKNLIITILQKDNEAFDIFYQSLMIFQPDMTWFVYIPKFGVQN